MRLHIASQASVQQNSQIADVCARWTGDDQIIQLFEEGVGIAATEILICVETEVASALHGRFVCNCAGSGTVTVDAVGAGTQDDYFAALIGEIDRAAQDGFEIAAAATIAAHGTRELATGDRAFSC